MGSFVFRWPHPEASDVHVTGTFDDWGKSVRLEKVGDVWEKDVELPNADEKILYKFVVNNQWIIDPTAPQEDDGHGNLNNVLHPEHIKTKASTAPGAFTTPSAAPTSTTAALAGGVPLEPRREATEVTPASDSHLNETHNTAPGAFPETPANERESYSVNPIPPTAGTGNPVNIPAGEKPPPLSEITQNSIHSAVTTARETYEKGGTNIPYIGGALAALGLGGAAASSKKENLIPESSLPMGEDADKSLDAGPFISSAGANTTTAALAGQVPLEANSATSGVPEEVKESIRKADVDPEATTSSEAVKEKALVEEELLQKVPETTETGEHAPSLGGAAAAPTSTSTSATPAAAVPAAVKESIAEAHAEPEAATSSEAVKEKSAVEQELLQRVPEATETGEHAPSLSGAGAVAASTTPAAAVPVAVKESIAEARAEPEAATSSEAVKEKSAVEQELLQRVPEHDEAGEPAPTIAAASSATAPAPTTETAIGAAPGQSAASAAAVADGVEDNAEPIDAAKTTIVPERTDADNTEYAPPHTTAAVAPGVSGSAAAAISDGAEDPTLLDEPAVQLGIKNDAEAVGSSTAATPAIAYDATTVEQPTETTTTTPAAPVITKEEPKEMTTSTPAAPVIAKEEPKATAPTSTLSTPKKATDTTPTSTPTSSASASATKDKKKKNRVSSFFKKIFD